MSKERRQRRRRPVDLAAEIHLENEQVLAVRCIDISMGGAQFASNDRFEFGVDVVVHIALSEKETLVLPAIIRWSGEGSVGVQFGSVRARHAFQLAELLRKLPSADGPASTS